MTDSDAFDLMAQMTEALTGLYQPGTVIIQLDHRMIKFTEVQLEVDKLLM